MGSFFGLRLLDGRARRGNLLLYADDQINCKILYLIKLVFPPPARRPILQVGWPVENCRSSPTFSGEAMFQRSRALAKGVGFPAVREVGGHSRVTTSEATRRSHADGSDHACG